MKTILKVLVSAVFLVALAVNININATKATKDATLTTTHQVANAQVECTDPYDFGGGRCSFFTQTCFPDPKNPECDPFNY